MSKVVYTPRSILLTGGAGFIGSGTVLRLIRDFPDYKVCAWEKGSVVTIFPPFLSHILPAFLSVYVIGFFFDLMLIDCSFGQAGLLFFRVQLG